MGISYANRIDTRAVEEDRHVFTALIWLDSLVLNTVQRLCHLWQRLTGRTNVWVAVQLTTLSIAVYFVWAVVEISASPWPARLGLGTFCAVLLYVLTKTVLRVPIEALEAAAYRRVQNGYANPRRAKDVFLRLPFLTLTGLLLYPSLVLYRQLGIRPFGYSLIALTTAILYLLACDPLPPGGSKVHAWWRQVATTRRWPVEAAQTLDRTRASLTSVSTACKCSSESRSRFTPSTCRLRASFP